MRGAAGDTVPGPGRVDGQGAVMARGRGVTSRSRIRGVAGYIPHLYAYKLVTTVKQCVTAQ